VEGTQRRLLVSETGSGFFGANGRAAGAVTVGGAVVLLVMVNESTIGFGERRTIGHSA
jgi:hypothetical protein